MTLMMPSFAPRRTTALAPALGGLAASLLAVLAAGCSGSGDAAGPQTVYPVKGKVLLPDGKPLTSGRVVFVSTKDPIAPSAPIGAGGEFSLTSGVSGEGAPAGEYKVRIEPDLPPAASGRVRRASLKLPFANQYSDEDTSGLKVTVKPEANDLEPFRLSSTVTAATSRVRD